MAAALQRIDIAPPPADFSLIFSKAEDGTFWVRVECYRGVLMYQVDQTTMMAIAAAAAAVQNA